MKGFGTRQQGDVGVGRAIRHFTSLGLTVSIPLTDSQHYDLVVDMDGRLQKVQIKTCTFKDKYKQYMVSLKTCGGNRSGTGKIRNFDNSAVDLLFIALEDGRDYLLPADKVTAKSALNIGKGYEEYKL